MLLFIILLLQLQGGGVARDVKPKEWESAGAALHISVHGWIDPSHIHSFIHRQRSLAQNRLRQLIDF